MTLQTGCEQPPLIAALFWFHRDFAECRNKLRIVRAVNPAIRIYALYSGPTRRAGAARRAIGRLVDDFFVHRDRNDDHWRWINGDRVIVNWYRERGHRLAWDSIVTVQWDLLVTRPFSDLLADVRPGEAVFSGDRPMAEVADWWGWAGRRKPEHKPLLNSFQTALADTLGYRGPLWCCLFIIAVLPRNLLAQLAEPGFDPPGFLEYKLPTLARVLGIQVRKVPALTPFWAADPDAVATKADRCFSAMRTPVEDDDIRDQLVRADGRRIFHPVHSVSPELLLRLAGAPPRCRFLPWL